MQSIALAPDGRRLFAWKDGKFIDWDIPSGKPGRISFESENWEGSWKGSVFSPDGKMLATMFEEEVTLWDVRTGKPLCKLPRAPFASFPFLLFSSDSKSLVVLKRNNELSLLDSQGIRWQKELPWNTPDEMQLLDTPDHWFLITWINQAGLIAKHEYQVIDLATGMSRSTIELEPLRSTASLSRNGRFLLAFEENTQEPSLFNQLENWWTGSMGVNIKEQMKVIDVLAGRTLAAVPAKGFTDKDGWSFSPYLLISDDGQTLIVANPQEKSWQVQCWSFPLHPPWTRVIGLPLAILFLAILVFRLKRRRSSHAAPQQQANPT